jgi:hypothetical protein
MTTLASSVAFRISWHQLNRDSVQLESFAGAWVLYWDLRNVPKNATTSATPQQVTLVEQNHNLDDGTTA